MIRRIRIMKEEDKNLRKALKQMDQALKELTGGKVGIKHNITDLKKVLSEEELNEMREIAKED